MQKTLSRYFPNIEICKFKTIDEAIVETSHGNAQAVIVNTTSIPDALDRFKDNKTLPYSIPAILCNLPDVDQTTKEFGVADYLVKPINQEALINAISRVRASGKKIENILIIDDEPDARQLFRRMLSTGNQEYRVLRSNDGLEAFDLMESEQDDLILLDLGMPRLDGFQFLEIKNQDKRDADIPVILVSARDPHSEPIVSSALAVTRGGGLTVQQVLDCIDSLNAILSPSPPTTFAASPTIPPA